MSFPSDKIKVAVLRGGPSPEYDVSLKTGQHVLSLLRETPDLYDPLDILISKEGDWHRHGIVREPERALEDTDVVFNALHGHYGEDGQVQQILESMNIPFTGSNVFGSEKSINKEVAKDIYKQQGMLTPQHEILGEDYNSDHLIYIFRNYLHPVIVKPSNGGSSIGMRLVHTFQELGEAVKHALGYSKKVIIEEFIKGKEGTCGVIENARGESLYALLPVEIRKPNDKSIFDFASKYSGETEEICPGNFRSEEQKLIESMAKQAHQALGLRHYSRSDFMITPKGKIYILETNSLPGFTQESLFLKALHATGWRPRDFVDHVLKLAM